LLYMLQTKHQFVDKYPILPNSEKLIVGTIHPHLHEKFQVPFFYGNVMSIWNILSDAFPGEMTIPNSLPSILSFLKRRKIAMSDTIVECERKSETALDEDLVPTKLHYGLLEQIKQSKVTDVYFTSGYGKNNAFKLFYVDLLKEKINGDIRKNRELTLGDQFFGRLVNLHVLYSPSGASNVGLSKSKSYLEMKDKYVGSKRPVYDFKVDYYRIKFT
jgi:hypothetical protein